MNISQGFIDYAKKNPSKIAFVVAVKHDETGVQEEQIFTYQDMLSKVSQYRSGLVKAGYQKGDRIILLTPLDIEFYAFMMAMLSLGVVAVFLDPGIGFKKFMVALQDSGAKAVVSIAKFYKYRFLMPQIWKKKLYSRDGAGLLLEDFNVLKGDVADVPAAAVLGEADHMLITFTSGSTGRSKGSDRNAFNVYHQLQVIREGWACSEDEIDFPTFPMFGFMNMCSGITTVLPALDFRKVSEFAPACILSQMQKWQVTRMSGSSAFLGKISTYLVDHGLTVPSLRNIAMGGAPVKKDFCQKLAQAFPNSRNVITYGSTEVAPISFVEMDEVVAAVGDGALVGKLCDGLTAAIVTLPETHSTFDAREAAPYEVQAGEWGEVIVKGRHVVRSYVDNPQAGLKNKITTPHGDVWHRTGDVGHLDEKGRLWLTGRMSELVYWRGEVLRPYIVEGHLNTLKGVAKSALIQVNKNKVIVVLEKLNDLNFTNEELKLALAKFQLEDALVKIVSKIPVDDRHNSKIDRIKLAKMV